MSEQKSKKRRNKAYYVQKSKPGQKERHLETGMKGFLVTCSCREKDSVREAYSILNEHADILYGPEKKDPEGASDAAEDIATSLAQELGDMKQISAEERRFLAVRTGTNSCMFIRTTLEQPELVMDHVMEDIAAKKKVKSRYILRFWPIQGTCKATEEKIESLAREVLPKFLEGQEKAPSYCINIKRRNNKGLDRFDLIRTIGRVVEDLNPDCVADLNHADLVISVDILTTYCCIGVLKNFRLWKKYNVQEMVADDQSAESMSESPKKRKLSETGPESEGKVPKLDGSDQDTPGAGGTEVKEVSESLKVDADSLENEPPLAEAAKGEVEEN